MSEINFLAEQIEKHSMKIMNKISSIIENELREVCVKHGVPSEKVILQCYPEGTYSIAVIVSKFKITNEFLTEPKKDIPCLK